MKISLLKISLMVNLHIFIKNDKFSILYFTYRLQVQLLQSSGYNINTYRNSV